MRLSVVMGLHLNVPESQLSDAGAREHRNRVWWTAYIFDRMWASKLGHPISVRDDVIEVDLPSNPNVKNSVDDFRDCAYFVASIRLARLSGGILHSIYSRKAEQKSLSQRVQEALKDLRQFVQDLPSHLHIESSDTTEPSPRPISLSLNLSFNQVKSTRPTLRPSPDTNDSRLPSVQPALFCFTSSEPTSQHGQPIQVQSHRFQHLPWLWQKPAFDAPATRVDCSPNAGLTGHSTPLITFTHNTSSPQRLSWQFRACWTPRKAGMTESTLTQQPNSCTNYTRTETLLQENSATT